VSFVLLPCRIYEPELLPAYPDSILTIYLALLVAGGYIGLPVVVVTFLVSRKVSRHPAIINFCITWIIYSVVYTLLCVSLTLTETCLSKTTAFRVFSGQRTKPPQTLCITQAALIHGSSVMSLYLTSQYCVSLTVYAPGSLSLPCLSFYTLVAKRKSYFDF
jgi:hypothetical protein